MSNVIPLNHGASFDYGEPDAEIVAKLEELLMDAKSGNMRGLIYGAVLNERVVVHGFSGGAESHLMVTVSAKLHHQIMSADYANWISE